MKFGVHLPNFGPLGGREPTVQIATYAESLGFASLWASDHVVLPDRIESRYPYSRTGAFIMPPSDNVVDPLISLAVAAGCTEQVALGTSVLVLPYRDPLLLAKMLASLDMLAGGRVILGVGAGWLKEEFEALNLPYFAQRGAVTDEWIRILHRCWEEPLVSFAGQFYRFAPVHFMPKPARPIPIWVGGHSPPALRRAGQLGDGWHAARLPVEELQRGIERVREHARAAGRDPTALEFSMSCVLDVLEDASKEQRAPTRDLIGTPAQIAKLLHRLAAIGISHLVLDFRSGTSLHGMLETIDRFHERVRPLLSR